jgi:hypothetical protein
MKPKTNGEWPRLPMLCTHRDPECPHCGGVCCQQVAPELEPTEVPILCDKCAAFALKRLMADIQASKGKQQ